MPNLTEGQKAFQDNILAMKKLGQENEARREREAKMNTEQHLEMMNARAAEAAAAAEQRRLDGIAKRNAHNARLRQERAERLAQTEQIKTTRLRAVA